MIALVKWWLPLILFALFVPFSATLDLSLSHVFYQNAHFLSNALVDFIFRYGVVPADLLFLSALLLLILSFTSTRWKKWRGSAWTLVLTLLVGAGLIVHVVLKDNWGRPRPRQITEFGGQQNFRPFYSPNFFAQSESSKSFPCGHCTMGFYFFALALLGKEKRNALLCTLGWVLAIGLGITLSLTRIAQGGHFLSDTVVSALIMWYTSLIFSRVFQT